MILTNYFITKFPSNVLFTLQKRGNESNIVWISGTEVSNKSALRESFLKKPSNPFIVNFSPWTELLKTEREEVSLVNRIKWGERVDPKNSFQTGLNKRGKLLCRFSFKNNFSIFFNKIYRCHWMLKKCVSTFLILIYISIMKMKLEDSIRDIH